MLFMTIVQVIISLLIGCTSVSARGGCNILSASIICSGYQVDDNELQDLSKRIEANYRDYYFLQVIITETEITHIPADAFKGIAFENLLIDGNHKLVYIDPQAFDEQTQCKTLLIISNEQLSDNNVFKLIGRLNIHEEIDFDFNRFKEVPSNAFSQSIDANVLDETGIVPSKIFFRKLVVSNNRIEHVATNAFHSIYSCNQIYLDHNKINHLWPHSFNLLTNLTIPDHHKAMPQPSTAEQLEIHMQSNNLTSDSFSENFLLLDDHSIPVILNLGDNHIAQLKENIFQPLLDKMVQVNMEGNLEFNCQDNAWIKQTSRYYTRVRGTKCW